MFKDINIIKRLYKDYTVKHFKKIVIAIIFSILVAGSTSGIAYLLDPAIEKIFIQQDKVLMYSIPIIIVTHETSKMLLMKSIIKIEKLDFVLKKIAILTIDKNID